MLGRVETARYVIFGHMLAQKLNMSVKTFINVQKHTENKAERSVVGST